MTHDELIEAVAKRLDHKLNYLVERDTLACDLTKAELLDLARAAIRVIAPAVEQETVAKIVAWMRGNCMSGKWRILASEIEAKWGER